MSGLKILIVNATLATRTGTETYARDLAIGLLRKGHSPMVYAPELGPIAEELRSSNVLVVDKLNNVAVIPDIIHGNHNTELITALLQFETVPGIFVCHSPEDWISAPPAHPRILAYVAVDDACRDRLVHEHSIPERLVRVHLHGADLTRFQPREPLPEKPARALVFSNNANHWTHLNAVQAACRRSGIQVDVAGAGMNATTAHPEFLLRKYDLVFAKARCALEALAVGSAVILCDAVGSGPLVTTAELDRLRRLNFGIHTLNEKVDANRLAQQIALYHASDATEVSRRIRAGAGLESVVDDALTLYRDVKKDFCNSTGSNWSTENRAVAEYLRWLTLATRQKQAETEAILTNSPTLKLRNRLGRLPMMESLLRRLSRFADPKS